jgi:hypothetical protein
VNTSGGIIGEFSHPYLTGRGHILHSSRKRASQVTAHYRYSLIFKEILDKVGVSVTYTG